MPSSKKATFERRNDLFAQKYSKLTLDSLYDSLDYFDMYKMDIQSLIWKNTKDLYSRNTSTSFYNCTNYYFEIKNNDEDIIDDNVFIIEKGLRKKGPKKNKRPDPIVEMGLLMDSTGLPMAYEIFSGNESEKLSMRSLLFSKRLRRPLASKEP